MYMYTNCSAVASKSAKYPNANWKILQRTIFSEIRRLTCGFFWASAKTKGDTPQLEH